MPATTTQEEVLNLVAALTAQGSKQVLHVQGDYSLSEDDFALLEGVLENSTFLHELVGSATSPAQAGPVAKAYARIRALSRALAMRKQTRLDYWATGLDSARKDELHTAVTTTVLLDLVTAQQTEPDGDVAVRDAVVIDPETGEATEVLEA